MLERLFCNRLGSRAVLKWIVSLETGNGGKEMTRKPMIKKKAVNKVKAIA